LFYVKERGWKIKLLVFTLAIFTLSAWLYTGYNHHRVIAATSSNRLMFWNAEHIKHGVDKAAAHVRSQNADIVGIVEAGNQRAKNQWQQLFTDRNVIPLEGEMLLITRGELIDKYFGELADRGRYNWLKVQLQDKTMNILLVDIFPNPLRSRAPAFAELN